MVGIKSKINLSPQGIATSNICTLLLPGCLYNILICIRVGEEFAKVSPIHLKIKHSGDHF